MASSKYLLGLIFIILVVWLTMILCLIIVYYLMPSMELSSIAYVSELVEAVFKLLVAGFILLIWLYSWNMLIRLYFQRNLNQSTMKQKGQRARKKKGNTGVSHTHPKSIP